MEKLVSLIKEKLGSRQIFYFCNDPERALGLEHNLPSYHIVCIDHTPLVDQLEAGGVSIFCLEKALGQLNAVYRSSVKLLEHPLAHEFVKKISHGEKPYIVVFKSSPVIEHKIKQLNWELLNPFSKINAELEQKISQYKILQPLGITFPETIITVLVTTNYADIVKRLGRPFVLQFDRGHTGEGTMLVDSENQYRNIQKQFGKREARLSRYITGPTYTVNCCATSHGTLAAGLSYQITGEPTCTSGKFNTCGNDFTDPYHEFSRIRLDLKKIADGVGAALFSRGYRGLFGLDLVYNRDNGRLYFVETNVRQPASVTFHTEAQLAQRQIPLLLFHYLELLHITYPEILATTIEKIPAFQVFLRNTETADVTVTGSVKRGIYDLKTMKWLKGGYRYEDIADEAQFLFSSAPFGKIISPNSQLSRIQAKRTLLGTDGLLNPAAAEFVIYLKDKLLNK